MTLRRDFLAFTAGAVVTKTVLPIAAKVETAHRWPDGLFPPGHYPQLDPHPDAALLIACDAFMAVDEGWYSWPDPETEGEQNAFDEVGEQWHDLLRGVASLRPKTRHGMQAKARAVLTAFDRDMPTAFPMDGSIEVETFAMRRFVQDVIDMGAA